MLHCVTIVSVDLIAATGASDSPDSPSPPQVALAPGSLSDPEALRHLFPVQSPAPAVNTKALIGPRRALGRSLSAQTRGLLVGGSVGDAPLLS
ncbi:hypothetical protein Q7C36_014330 [Tachysurus vachellii]|uniref:Secreted protein n=1 Tax=Tachysurus vachellii TaxID=175792 RepID=A0AA88MEF6_TACVA|nr:hypothetical protein Q7C36_014330 [Tachysurus vachellii]